MRVLLPVFALSLVGLGIPFASLMLGGGGAVTARGRSPEGQRRFLAKEARINAALKAFRQDVPSRRSEIQEVIAGLEPGDFRRLDFAEILDKRGETQRAYNLVREYAHFLRFSVTDDAHMALYAKLAEKAGHSEEAAWARDRMGEDGHFRIWRAREKSFFNESLGWSMHPESYEPTVDRHIKYGLELYPAHYAGIEALRRELLGKPERP